MKSSARVEKELSKRHQRACDAAGLLNALTLRPLAQSIPDLNAAQEMRTLSGVLKSGLREGEPLPLKVLSDYSIIDIKEVAARGITRMPPANAKGEELRDVMVWLGSLSYCRTSKRAVAFVSDDMGFWTEGGRKRLSPNWLLNLSAVTSKFRSIRASMIS